MATLPSTKSIHAAVTENRKAAETLATIGPGCQPGRRQGRIQPPAVPAVPCRLVSG